MWRSDLLNGSSYTDTQHQLLSIPLRIDRRRELVRMSDALVAACEDRNLAAYPVGSVSRAIPVVPISRRLSRAINDLRAEVGLPRVKLDTTAAALAALFEAQAVILGVQEEEEEAAS